ncbi:hypothetical protein D3C84_1048890 [compost metagenome]
MCAVAASGALAKGGTRVGWVSISSCSRRFQSPSITGSGRQPINPGWIRPAKLTPGMCLELVNMPLKSQMAFCALGK